MAGRILGCQLSAPCGCKAAVRPRQLLPGAPWRRYGVIREVAAERLRFRPTAKAGFDPDFHPRMARRKKPGGFAAAVRAPSCTKAFTQSGGRSNLRRAAA